MADPDQTEIEYCEHLRAQLKEFGLEHTVVRLMTVEERGKARRAIRTALETYVLALQRKQRGVSL